MTDKKPTPEKAGDFSSAATAADNQQPAGSGGPFDPANTAKAHMSVNQTQESLSAGNPTTGGVTPKLSAENMANLSERDREAAQSIIDAKTPAEKSLAANAGTGAATPGTAKMIAHPLDPELGPDAASPAQQAGRTQQDVPNEEANRLAREEAAHKVAVEKSAEAQRGRTAAKPVEAPAAKKVPAKTTGRR